MSQSNQQLMVVSWYYHPFHIDFTYIGTKDEILTEANHLGTYTFKSHQHPFVNCLNEVTNHRGTQTFRDRFHGLLVTTTDNFSNLDAVKSYVTKHYHGNL